MLRHLRRKLNSPAKYLLNPWCADTSTDLGKPQFEKGRVYLGIAQMGGGLNACLDGLGHLFREEVPQLKWAFV